ncbi:MAG: hypothetical protein AAF639_10670 [Chloroflexota bacterium]
MTTITLDVPEYTLPIFDSVCDQLPLVLDMGLSRLAPVSIMAYMEAVALLVQRPSPETIVNFHFSEEIETQIKTLLTKNKNDELPQAEEVELDRLTHLELQLRLVKARALVKLHQSATFPIEQSRVC